MAEVIYRTLAELGGELRADGDQRIISGVAVPYGVETRIDPRLTESFAPGAFRSQTRDPSRIPLYREHGPMGGKLIGKVTQLRETPNGLHFEARVSPTADGDDTLALVRDGVLDAVSIGFRTGQDARLPNGTVQRRSATMTELAVVQSPAYQGAKILATRSAEQPQCATCGQFMPAPEDDADAALRAEVAAALAQMRALPLPPAPDRRAA